MSPEMKILVMRYREQNKVRKANGLPALDLKGRECSPHQRRGKHERFDPYSYLWTGIFI
jgi:hypothetical protein